MNPIDEPLFSWVVLLARLSLAAVFLVSGIHKAVFYDQATAEFRDARAYPVVLLLPLTIALHLAAGLALVGGIYIREASLGLALFTVVATARVHAFWRMRGSERLARSRIALAHLALVGGLLLLAATGPGRLVVPLAGLVMR